MVRFASLGFIRCPHTDLGLENGQGPCKTGWPCDLKGGHSSLLEGNWDVYKDKSCKFLIGSRIVPQILKSANAEVRYKKNSVMFMYNLSIYSWPNYIICRLLIPCKCYINRCWYAANSDLAFGNFIELFKFLTRID